MLDRSLVVIDLESSGKNPDTASMIQIGMVILDKNALKVSNGFSKYVNPYTPVWEEEAEGVHKLSKGFLKQFGCDVGLALKQLEETIGDNLKHYNLAMWSNGWDIQLLRNAYQHSGREFPFSHRSYDIASFVRIYLRANKMLGRDKAGLVNCARSLGIDTDPFAQHDAYHDALLAARVLQETILLITSQRDALLRITQMMNIKL
jgi:DNA polymerase III epsilon subunit-like protein